MRLSKSSLVAAAYALTSIAAQAQVQPVTVLNATETVTEIGAGGTLSAVQNTIYNPAGGGTIAITAGQTLTIVSEFATTVNAAFLELGDTSLSDLRAINGVVYKVDPLTGLPTGGNVVKEGGGVLQINSWTNLSGAQREGTNWWKDTDGSRGYDYPFTIWSHLVSRNGGPASLQPTIDFADFPLLADNRNGRRLNGLQGTFTVNQGTVRLAGFLNVWYDQGSADLRDFRPLGAAPRAVTEIADNALLDTAGEAWSPSLAPRMTGVSGIILNGSSVLELTNSPLLVPTGGTNNVTQGNALRVQYLRNLQAGIDNDQFQTELIVGTTSEYRALLHIEQGSQGSIGILAGAGSVVKSGAGSFTVLNESRLTGDFTVSGGTVILDSAGGRALATAASVNLASVMDPSDRNSSNLSAESELSRRGAHNRYLFQSIDTDGDGIEEPRFKPAYAPDAGTSTLALNADTGLWEETLSGAQLELANDQVIRNFQSNFAYRAGGATVAEAVRRAADVTDRGELVVAGTGIGSTVVLGGNTLVIRQDAQRDGYYRGAVLGAFEFDATLGSPEAGTYDLAFDRLPGFGTFQLLVTGVDGVQRLTDSIEVGSAAELQSSLAFTLGLAASQVSVADITADSGTALAYRVTLSGGATVDAVDKLLSGRLVLEATSDAAKLALILEQGTFAETEVRRGSLIVNAQGLGTSRINTSAGELRIYQNDAATLQATLLGAGTVRVVGKASIDNGSGELLEINSAGTLGTLNFATQQRNFSGELIVNDGIDVSFSSLSGTINDTFLNARAITLDSTGSVVGSTLRFNNTDQTVRNLAGDVLSRIELGRGTMTLVATDASRRFLGTLSGVGSVIKRGAANFEFRGAGATDFYGATVVQQGAVSVGSADALRKTSGLVLLSGATFNAGGRSQRVGALFGEAGSVVNLGAATLTVGFDHARVTELRQQFAAAALLTLPLSHNYLGTTDAVEILPLSGNAVGAFPVGAASFDRAPLRLGSFLYPEPLEDDFLLGDLGMADQTRLYLERVAYRFDRDGDGLVSESESALAATSAAGLDFAGRITGSGAAQSVTVGGETASIAVSLNKTGWETLRLTGDNTFTGALVIRQGTVEALPSSLASASAIIVLANSSTIDLDGDGVTEDLVLAEDGVTLGYDLDLDGVFTDADRVADGTLALFVDTGDTAAWTKAILGDGNVVKTGEGTLVLDPGAALYTGTTTVAAGTLDLTLVETAPGSGIATLGDVLLEDGATLVLRTDNGIIARDLAYVAPNGIIGIGDLGSGNFTKAGLGTLAINALRDSDTGEVIGHRLDLTGTLTVLEGALATDQLPAFGFFQELVLASGAEFRLGITDDDVQFFAAELSGAGTFVRSGNGVLVLAQDTDPLPLVQGSGFTGTLRLDGGLTVLTSAGSYPNARIDLNNAGTTLEFDDAGDYAFAGLTGEAGTVLDLLGTDRRLALSVAAGRTDIYAGLILGGGDLDKTGAGILSLAPEGGSNDLGDVRVLSGTLRVTVDALGDPASIAVSSGAFLEFNADEGEDEDYAADITGAGRVSKFGAGRIALVGNGLLPTGDLRVLEGTLAVDDRRVGSAIPAAAVSSGATFELILTGDRALAAQVTGAGSFAVSGPHTLTLTAVPSYTGLTSLLGGADLAFAGTPTALTLSGLAAAAGSNVNLAGLSSLTLVQGIAADFAGTFSGSANLVIQGDDAFRFTGANGNLAGFAGTVTVDGGILQVGFANTKALTLADGSTLQIFVDVGEEGSYGATTTLSSGTSTLVKVGEGTLDLTSGLPLTGGAGTLAGLEVREGRALVGVVAGQILGGAQLAVSDTGAIAVQVGAGDTVTVTQSIATAGGSTGGSFEKLGAGTLVLAAGATSAADLLVTAGTLQFGTTSQRNVGVAGDIVVATAGTLTGTAVTQGNLLLNGTVAPGYSPGTLDIGGDLTFAASSVYDAEVLGAQSDRIIFGGALAIDPTARLRVTGDTPIGTRHVLLSGSFAGNPAFASSEIYTAPFGNADSVAYILAYPGDSLGQPNALVAVAVRPTQQGAAAAALLTSASSVGGVAPAFIAQLSELARVEVAANGQVIDLTQGTLGRRLAALSEDEAPGAIKSLTGLAYLSGIGMAHLGASADHEAVSRRLEQRRFDRGYMSVKGKEFFVDATSASWDAGSKSYSPGYDLRRTGALAGQHFDFGPDLTAGWALSLDRSKASLAGGGQVDADQIRVLGFAGSVLDDEATFVEVGASLGLSSMKAARTGLGGGVTAKPDAFLASAWARVGHGTLLGRRTSLTPFAQLDISHAAIGAFSESGNNDTALDVGDLKQTAVRARVGGSLAHAWDSDRGDWRYRLSLDVAFVAALSGKEMGTQAANDGLIGDVNASGDPLDRGGVLVTPAFTFGPDNDTSYGLSAEFRRLDGGDALSLNFSFRRRF